MPRYKEIVLIFSCFWNGVSGHAQNLVPNYSFEQYSLCPSAWSQIELAVPWFQQNYSGSSSDFFHQCSSNFGVPNHGFSHQYARTGGGYAGIEVYQIFQAREYIEVKLISPLMSGKKYCASFFVNLDDSARYGIKEIGMYFSKDSVQCYCSFLNFTPQIEYAGNPILDTMNWVEVKGEFIASGGEQFITIGNFRKNSATTVWSQNTSYGYSYYNIDDVSVYCCDANNCIDIPVKVDIFIPNAFSPNGDGNNDVLFVRSNQRVESLDFAIYDRWGELVFQTNDITQGWDGTYQGKQLNNGIFLYYCKATINGREFFQKGDISLIR